MRTYVNVSTLSSMTGRSLLSLGRRIFIVVAGATSVPKDTDGSCSSPYNGSVPVLVVLLICFRRYPLIFLVRAPKRFFKIGLGLNYTAIHERINQIVSQMA